MTAKATPGRRAKSLRCLKGQFARLYMDALDAPRSRRALIARAFASVAAKMHRALGTTGRRLSLDSPEYTRPVAVADYCRRRVATDRPKRYSKTK